MTERWEQTNKQTSKWPRTLTVYTIIIWLNVHCFHTLHSLHLSVVLPLIGNERLFDMINLVLAESMARSVLMMFFAINNISWYRNEIE